MRILIFLLILFVEINSVFSQNYDLIVEINGDSIACKIDSISGASIYLKMRSNNNWIQTLLGKNEVLEYKYNAIDWKSYVYKPGTSYILSARNPARTIFDLPKNSINIGYYFLAVSGFYERTIPTGDRSAVIAGGGILRFVAFSDETIVYGKVGGIKGGTKSFFEYGTQIIVVRGADSEFPRILPVLGYRYLGNHGFTFRADVTIIIDKDEHIRVLPAPGISFGYSF
jgi:hypothetical protein